MDAAVAAARLETATAALAAEGHRGTEDLEMAAAVRLSELAAEITASQKMVAAQSAEGQR